MRRSAHQERGRHMQGCEARGSESGRVASRNSPLTDSSVDARREERSVFAVDVASCSEEGAEPWDREVPRAAIPHTHTQTHLTVSPAGSTALFEARAPDMWSGLRRPAVARYQASGVG